jgi:hypothetical protein
VLKRQLVGFQKGPVLQLSEKDARVEPSDAPITAAQPKKTQIHLLELQHRYQALAHELDEVGADN